MAEVLFILSIAMKGVKRTRASGCIVICKIYFTFDYFHILFQETAGKDRSDSEDALKRSDSLIQEEVRMAIAQTMKATFDLEDGAQPVRPVTYLR